MITTILLVALGQTPLVGQANVHGSPGARKILNPNPTTDAAPGAANVYAGNAYPRAAVNTGGANVLLDPGEGSSKSTVTTIVAEGDTISVTCNGTTTTRTAKNPGPAGAGEFLCTVDVSTCATNMAASFAGISCFTATASGAVVYFEPVAGTTYSIDASVADAGGGGAFATAVNGADGQVLLGNDGTQTAPGLAFALDTNTGIFRNAADVMRLVVGGATKLSIEGNLEMYTHLDMNGLIVYGNSRREIPSADLAVGSCSIYNESFDTGGATVEWCYCRVANAWFCLPSGTTNGPAD